MRCPRCQSDADALVTIDDALAYHYRGLLTRVCVRCRDSMILQGDLIPSGTRELVLRAQRVADRQRAEFAQVRRKQLLVRAAALLAAIAAGFALWRFLA